MSRYKTVIFDLFDTLIVFDYKLLPLININGKSINSTSKAVYDTFNTKIKNISFETFFDAFSESYKEFQKLKSIDNREYSNYKRFEIMIRNLSLNSSDISTEFLEDLSKSHMKTLSTAMLFPKHHVNILDYVKEKNYKIGILSNFDHADTAYRNLERFNIINYFNKILISEEIGYRKPNKVTFEIALRELNSTAIETIFIGDNYNCDILGASECCIDSIWLNKDNHLNYSTDIPKFVIDDLSYIEEIL